MVNSTNYAMVNSLAGLKRLEAQIQLAMLEAGGKAQTKPEQQPKVVADKIESEVAKSTARARSVLNGLDMTA
ncbi:MAG: hypothetical protein ACKVQS_04795 [Fimbriimonadaceae bacterium]